MTFSEQTPFLITSRKFPQDPVQNEYAQTKSYTEIALAVNDRTIGRYQTIQTLTGNTYFEDGNPQTRKQSFRKCFIFEDIASGATLTIDHGISGLTQFTFTSGECITDVPDYRSIPWASATIVTDQIQITKTQTQIIIVNGATAPNITSGMIVLEYLLN